MNDLEKLFVAELKSAYDAEHQFAKALAEMGQHANRQEVKQALIESTHQAKSHRERLEQLFQTLGHSAPGKTCHGMRGILAEGESLEAELEHEAAIDAALLAVAEKAQYYRICSYGTLCTWAEELGSKTPVDGLKQTLGETKQTCAQLSQLADSVQSAEWKQEHELERLFVRQLRQMFDGEHLLVSALAEVEFYAVSRLLKLAVHYHMWETKKQVQRLEEAFLDLGETADRRPCDGIEGIIDDAQVAVMEFLGNSALDAALIAAGQKAERYEMAAYENLSRWAARLGRTNVLELLQQNLSEETSTDKKLSLAAELLRNAPAKRHVTAKRPQETAELLKVATHGE